MIAKWSGAPCRTVSSGRSPMVEPSGRIPFEYAELAPQLRGAEARPFPPAVIGPDRAPRRAGWREAHRPPGRFRVRWGPPPRTGGTPPSGGGGLDSPPPAAGPAAMRVDEFTDRSAWLAAIDQVRADIEAEIESES